MKIYHDLAQGSPEWMDVRRRNFTASELGPWALNPVSINLTIPEIKAELESLGEPFKASAKRDELLALLPNPERYATLCDGARTAIISKIKQGRMLAMMGRTFDEMTDEESIWLEREQELAAQSEKQFGYNIPVKYGKLLEPFARECYERMTGFDVAEVGFIEHDSGGFGCSPDGLVSIHGNLTLCNPTSAAINATHGIEIKCPVPETHLEWLLAGTLPDKHALQCHAGMAVSGLNRWDFLSYCPGEAPLLVTVLRDETTERLEDGLKILVAEKAKMKARLSELWRNQYEEGVKP